LRDYPSHDTSKNVANLLLLRTLIRKSVHVTRNNIRTPVPVFVGSRIGIENWFQFSDPKQDSVVGFVLKKLNAYEQ